MEWMIQDPDTLANVLLFLSVQDTISLSSTNKSLSSNLPSQVKSALVDSTQSLFLCQKFPRLEKLIVTEPKQTFEKTLLQLIFNFPFLCKLSIEHIRSPFLFQKIEQLKKLKKLKLSFDTRFENLNCSFQELGLQSLSILGTNLKTLPLLSASLIKLSLYGCQQLNQNEFKGIGSCRSLEFLNLGHTQIDNSILSGIIENLLELKELLLFKCQRVSDDGVIGLSKLHSLFQVKLSQTNISSLSFIPSLIRIDFLGLSGTKIDDDQLIYLNSIPSLRHITLSGCNITGKGLIHLPKSLQRLGLDGTLITDSIIPILSTLTELNQISVRDTQLSIEGLKELKGVFKKLEWKGAFGVQKSSQYQCTKTKKKNNGTNR